jgi:hypothetical protein
MKLRKGENMKKTRYAIFALMLLLAVGFAAVSTTMMLSGTSRLATDPVDFDIYFASATTDDLSTAVISQDKKSITFTTRNLTTPGEFAEVDFYVYNGSSQYDANVSIDITFDPIVDNVDYSEYFSVNSRGIGSTIDHIDSLSYQFGYVRITLNKPVIDDVQITFTATLTSSAMERSYTGIKTPDYLSIESGNGKTIGDEISLHGEHFYLLSKEGTTLNYISKYLLNVGSYTEPGELGVQNSGCNGGRKCFNAIDTYYYLDSNDNYLPKYINNESLPYYVYDENNTDYEYVEAYARKLAIECNIDLTGRLANYDDIAWFENGVILDGGKGSIEMPEWFNINGDSFKLGISGENYGHSKTIWTVVGNFIRYNNYGAGVKPVISFDESVLDNIVQ